MKRFLLHAGFLFCALLVFYLGDVYRRHYFHYNGEAFMKGYGHLLQEDLAKGVFFLFIWNLLTVLFLSASLSFLAGKELAKPLRLVGKLIIGIILGLLVAYVFYKLLNTTSAEFSGQMMRNLEIVLTWLFRVFGIYTGYLLYKKSPRFIAAE